MTENLISEINQKLPREEKLFVDVASCIQHLTSSCESNKTHSIVQLASKESSLNSVFDLSITIEAYEPTVVTLTAEEVSLTSHFPLSRVLMFCGHMLYQSGLNEYLTKSVLSELINKIKPTVVVAFGCDVGRTRDGFMLELSHECEPLTGPIYAACSKKVTHKDIVASALLSGVCRFLSYASFLSSTALEQQAPLPTSSHPSTAHDLIQQNVTSEQDISVQPNEEELATIEALNLSDHVVSNDDIDNSVNMGEKASDVQLVGVADSGDEEVPMLDVNDGNGQAHVSQSESTVASGGCDPNLLYELCRLCFAKEIHLKNGQPDSQPDAGIFYNDKRVETSLETVLHFAHKLDSTELRQYAKYHLWTYGGNLRVKKLLTNLENGDVVDMDLELANVGVELLLSMEETLHSIVLSDTDVETICNGNWNSINTTIICGAVYNGYQGTLRYGEVLNHLLYRLIRCTSYLDFFHLVSTLILFSEDCHLFLPKWIEDNKIVLVYNGHYFYENENNSVSLSLSGNLFHNHGLYNAYYTKIQLCNPPSFDSSNLFQPYRKVPVSSELRDSDLTFKLTIETFKAVRFMEIFLNGTNRGICIAISGMERVEYHIAPDPHNVCNNDYRENANDFYKAAAVALVELIHERNAECKTADKKKCHITKFTFKFHNISFEATVPPTDQVMLPSVTPDVLYKDVYVGIEKAKSPSDRHQALRVAFKYYHYSFGSVDQTENGYGLKWWRNESNSTHSLFVPANLREADAFQLLNDIHQRHGTSSSHK